MFVCKVSLHFFIGYSFNIKTHTASIIITHYSLFFDRQEVNMTVQKTQRNPLNLMLLLLIVLGILNIILAYKLFTKPAQTNEPVVLSETISVSTNPKDTSILTLVSSYTPDINADGISDQIDLLTTATKDEAGEIQWDDGQNWTMIAHINNDEYLLFDAYVQLGQLIPYIYTAGENNAFHIALMQPGSASLTLSDYQFNHEKNQFEKRIIFNPQNVNLLN